MRGSARVTVREASEADRAAAMAFIAPGTTRGRLSMTLLRASQGILWVAVTGEGASEQLVGLLLGVLHISAEPDELVGYIQELLVHPEFRRLGVANHLLDAAEAHFLDTLGCGSVSLVTSPENDAALQLYRSRGYSMSQVRISKRHAPREDGGEQRR
jgi:ribosomal protein S18 acetylase RimI-like enzyme